MNATVGQMKIFLVDDDPFFLGILEEYLQHLGYTQLTTFTESADCLHQLTKQPDLIFLDFNMDNLNGIEVLKKIKRFNTNQLVIFVSGQEKINIAVDALKYGAFDYILKDDISEQKLHHLMQRIIHFKKLLKARTGKNPLKLLLRGLGF